MVGLSNEDETHKHVEFENLQTMTSLMAGIIIAHLRQQHFTSLSLPAPIVLFKSRLLAHHPSDFFFATSPPVFHNLTQSLPPQNNLLGIQITNNPFSSSCLISAARALLTVSFIATSSSPSSSTNFHLAEVKEKATPDSQKSALGKATESVSSTLDKGISSVQPGTLPSTSSRSRTD